MLPPLLPLLMIGRRVLVRYSARLYQERGVEVLACAFDLQHAPTSTFALCMLFTITCGVFVVHHIGR